MHLKHKNDYDFRLKDLSENMSIGMVLPTPTPGRFHFRLVPQLAGNFHFNVGGSIFDFSDDNPVLLECFHDQQSISRWKSSP